MQEQRHSGVKNSHFPPQPKLPITVRNWLTHYLFFVRRKSTRCKLNLAYGHHTVLPPDPDTMTNIYRSQKMTSPAANEANHLRNAWTTVGPLEAHFRGQGAKMPNRQQEEMKTLNRSFQSSKPFQNRLKYYREMATRT